MGLAEDLLEQARHLAERDTTRPKQANLRRAVSSAYYAIFHLLVAEAVQSVLAGNHPELMNRVSRVFQHGEMKQICRQVQQVNLPEALIPLFPHGVPVEIIFVAKTFVDLQEARQTADYDVGARLSRSNTLALVVNVEEAFEQWNGIAGDQEAQMFLAALAFGARWSR